MVCSKKFEATFYRKLFGSWLQDFLYKRLNCSSHTPASRNISRKLPLCHCCSTTDWASCQISNTIIVEAVVANKLAGLTNFHVLQTNGALTAVSRNFFILASQHHRCEWHCAAPQQISELLKEGNKNFARCHRSCFDFSLHAGDVAAQLLQAFLPALRICPAALKLVVGEDDLGKLTAILLHF